VPKHQHLLARLSDAGIAPRYLLRIEAELRDHYADIEREAFAADSTTEEAAKEARLRLGDDETIAAEFLAHPELKLWIYRSPLSLLCLELIAQLMLLVLSRLERILARRAEMARYGIAFFASAALMSVLLLGMHSLVRQDLARSRTVGISVARQEAATSTSTMAKDAREMIVQPSLVLPRPKSPGQDTLDTSSGAQHDEALAGSMVVMGDLELQLLDGDYLPIVKVAPVYPSRALSQGLEGFVVVEFTVARSGAVKDVIVVESTDSLFERAAVEAAYRFKYRPRIIAGQSVEVPGVRNRITFDIAV